VTLSYLEIYNENIRDLLEPESGHLDLREEGKGRQIQVAGLSEVTAGSTQEVREKGMRHFRNPLQLSFFFLVFFFFEVRGRKSEIPKLVVLFDQRRGRRARSSSREIVV